MKKLSIVIILIALLATISFRSHVSGSEMDTSVSSKALYDETNTYDYLYDSLDLKGYINKPKGSEEKDLIGDVFKSNYRYNIKQRNENKVLDTTPITVFTPGLGTMAEGWSGNLNSKGKMVFGYNSKSIITRMYNDYFNTDCNVILMQTFVHYTFFYLNNNEIAGKLVTYNKSESLNFSEYDFSKPTIVVFETYQNSESNDYVYTQFNYAISTLLYEYKKYLGALPKLNLVGHSRGGLINLMYMLDHPDLVNSVFSIGTPYFGSTSASVDMMFGGNEGGNSLGEKDIINSNVYLKYYNRYNDNISLYENIDIHMIGGYSDLSYLPKMFTKGFFVEKNGKALGNTTAVLVGLALYYLTLHRIKPSTFLKKVLANIISTIDLNIKVDDLCELLYSNIDVPYFYNDGLVDLVSQIGKNSAIQTRFYRGDNIHIKKKMFTWFNSDLLNTSKYDLPVVHNIECYDNEIINYILSNIKCEDSNYNLKPYNIRLINDSECYITAYNRKSNDSEIVIPESYEGYSVVGIDSGAFSEVNNNMPNLRKITMPKSIKVLKGGTLEGIEGLNEIDLNSVENIEEGAITNLINLNNINIPSSVNYIGVDNFYNCPMLNNINVNILNEKFSSIDGVLYSKNCETLVYYPEGKDNKTYIIDNRTLNINDRAFYNNKFLEEINLSNTKSIGKEAFKDCKSLNNVISKEAEYMYYNSFLNTPYERCDDYIIVGKCLYKCNSDDEEEILMIDKSVRKIISYAFVDTNAKEIDISENTYLIEENAFSGLDNLMVFVEGKTEIKGDTSNLFKLYISQKFADYYNSSDNIDNSKIYCLDTLNGNDCMPVSTHKYNVVLSYIDPNGVKQTTVTSVGMINGEFIYKFTSPIEKPVYVDSMYYSNGLMNKYYENDIIYLSNDICFDICYDLHVYSISYISNIKIDNADLVRTFTYYDEIHLKTISIPGYDFVGWYKDTSYTQLVETIKYESSDLALYAKYRLNVNYGRLKEYKITDSGRFKNKYDAINIEELCGFSPLRLRMQGFNVVHLEISFEWKLIDDGNQYIYVYGQRENNDKYELGAFTIECDKSDNDFNLELDIDLIDISNSGEIYILYDASGKGDDDWKNYNLSVNITSKHDHFGQYMAYSI